MPDGTTSSPPSGHFARLNALVEGGWLAVLTPSELAVWVAYEKYAAPDGTAYPNSTTLARLIGHGAENHLGEARSALAKYGLLEVIDRGGGRGRSCVVRMLVPAEVPSPSRPERGDVSDDAKGPDSGRKGSEFRTLSKRERVPIRELKGPNLGAKGSESGRTNKDEQPIEQPKEQKGSADEPRGLFGDLGELDARVSTPGKREAHSGRAERKLTPEHQATREAFSDWWVFVAYPGRFGVKYEFGAAGGGRNAKAVMTILGSANVGWDLEAAKAVATAFLNDRDPYLSNRGHKLYDLSERIERFAKPAVAAGGKVNGRGNKNGTDIGSGGASARDGEFSQNVSARNVL